MERTTLEGATNYLACLEKTFMKDSSKLIDIVPFSRCLNIFQEFNYQNLLNRAVDLYVRFCETNKIADRKRTVAYLSTIVN